MPTIKFSPEVFRRETLRRLMDVRAVQKHCGLHARRSVWDRVEAGTLPAPLVVVPRAYALWDRDEIEAFVPNGKK